MATANDPSGGYQQPRLTASALARMQQLQQGTEQAPALPSTTTRSLYDVKAMQKEAVLSYVKVIYYDLLSDHFWWCFYSLFHGHIFRLFFVRLD